MEATTSAHLNPLCLMHEITATFMGYGIYETDSLEIIPLNVVFVDVGHASMQVYGEKWHMMRFFKLVQNHCNIGEVSSKVLENRFMEFQIWHSFGTCLQYFWKWILNDISKKYQWHRWNHPTYNHSESFRNGNMQKITNFQELWNLIHMAKSNGGYSSRCLINPLEIFNNEKVAVV